MPPRRCALLLLLAALAACADAPGSASPDEAADVDADDVGEADADAEADAGRDVAPDAPASAPGLDLPARREADPAEAARGESILLDAPLGPGLVPRRALESLWAVWGTGPLSGERYWAAFHARYGTWPAPWDNGGLPMGMRDRGGSVAFDCTLCHAAVIAGEPVVGLGNSTFDMQALFDDLLALAELAAQLGLPRYTPPFTIEDRTGAAGVNDAFGLGFALGTEVRPPETPLRTHMGFQRPRPWWSVRYKDRLYADGSGRSGELRPMMATLLAFGLSPAELAGKLDDFRAIDHYILALQPPPWPFAPPDAAAAERGREVFDATCASCHGVHSGPEAAYPDQVIPAAEIGTDPVRAETFGPEEAAWLNEAFLAPGEGMEATGGYLAPPLVGIWATAPYLHNGSVPDLTSLLDPAQRPTRWRRTQPPDDYDADRVGWRFEAVDAPPPDTAAGRKTFDATRAGLDKGGHTFGEGLSAAQRSDLLEYLKGL